MSKILNFHFFEMEIQQIYLQIVLAPLEILNQAESFTEPIMFKPLFESYLK